MRVTKISRYNSSIYKDSNSFESDEEINRNLRIALSKINSIFTFFKDLIVIEKKNRLSFLQSTNFNHKNSIFYDILKYGRVDILSQLDLYLSKEDFSKLINDQVKNDLRPIELAIEYGIEELVKILVEKGANLNLKSKFGDTPLTSSIYFDNEMISYYLAEKSSNLDQENYFKTTALIIASTFNKDWLVFNLALKGANVDAQDAKGFTALIIASALGNENLVEILLRLGADPNITDIQGFSALDYANITKNYIISDILKSSKAKICSPLLSKRVKKIFCNLDQSDKKKSDKTTKDKQNALILFGKYNTKTEENPFSPHYKIHVITSFAKYCNVDARYVLSEDDLRFDKKKYDYVVLSAHSNTNIICFTNSFSINRNNLNKISFPPLSKKGVIILEGCNTGKKNGIAEKISRKVNRTVIASFRRVTIYNTQISLKEGKLLCRFYNYNDKDTTREIIPPYLTIKKILSLHVLKNHFGFIKRF